MLSLLDTGLTVFDIFLCLVILALDVVLFMQRRRDRRKAPFRSRLLRPRAHKSRVFRVHRE